MKPPTVTDGLGRRMAALRWLVRRWRWSQGDLRAEGEAAWREISELTQALARLHPNEKGRRSEE